MPVAWLKLSFIPLGFVETAEYTVTIGDETAIDEPAVQKPASRERNAAKNTAFEAHIHKQADVEQGPVEIAFLEASPDKGGVNGAHRASDQ